MGRALRKMGPNRGSYRTEDEALAAIVKRLVQVLDPEAIWLFGSRAQGTHTPRSDFDLLVVTKDEVGAAAWDYARVDEPVLGLGIACDVLPCPKSVFERKKAAMIGMVKAVVSKGRMLYERR